jgi:hypothetical protein
MELPPPIAAVGPIHVPLPPAVPVGGVPTDADIIAYQAYVTHVKAIYATFPGAIDIAAICHWEAYVTSLHARQNHAAAAMEGLLAPVLTILLAVQQQQGVMQQQLGVMQQQLGAVQQQQEVMQQQQDVMQQQQGVMQQQLGVMIQRQDAIQISVNRLVHRDSNKAFFKVNKATRDRRAGQLNFCFNADGALPEVFPVNMHEFTGMNAATTTGFLDFYGLDQGGSIATKKRRLLDHLCA